MNALLKSSGEVKKKTKKAKKRGGLMHSVKDPLGLRVPGVYQILCSCGRVYIRQTGRTITITGTSLPLETWQHG